MLATLAETGSVLNSCRGFFFFFFVRFFLVKHRRALRKNEHR